MDDRLERTTMEGDGPAMAGLRLRDTALAAGDVLNGIYKVERFIARGGMGEVFEGVNVETDERVAIKAIRSHLARDPKIVMLFRKEARVLTHIAHPAIVQYRVFARDPQLDLHYIVTDFINGEPITRYLDRERPGMSEVVTLARRLASGLEAAHDHGAIHRDMSPDNILLPDGRIERAKIIDFGIAKSLDLTAETVVGEGFAGKLGYVAPEQFGDFGRQIGPWTDVYSTALVLLAFARGKAPAMGTTLSEAVERRRVPVDLSDLPVPIAPLIERMLVPEPAGRIRSMREVLVALDGIRIAGDLPLARGKAVALPGLVADGDQLVDAEGSRVASRPRETAETTYAPTLYPAAGAALRPSEMLAKPAVRAQDVPATLPLPGPARTPASQRKGRGRRLILAAFASLVLLVFGTVLYKHAPQAPVVQNNVVQPSQPASPAKEAPLLTASDRAGQWNLMARDLPCAWITARATTEDGPTQMTGGSGDLPGLPARLAGKPRNWGAVETREVEPLTVTQCGVIDALRPYRATAGEQGAGVLALSTSRILLDHPTPACPGGGVAEVTAANRDPGREWALIGLEPDGRLLQIAGSSAEFARLARQQSAGFSIGADGLYHVSLCHALAGSSAVFLLETKRPVDLGLRTGQAALPGADFAQRLADQGRDQGIRIFAQWARVEPAPASDRAGPPAAGITPRSPSSPMAARPLAQAGQPGRPSPTGAGQGHDLTREQAALETAELNRRELARIQEMQAPNRNADLCRAYDGAWHDVGRLERDACLAQAIRGRCNVTFVQFKNRLYRRQGSEIQEQRGSHWRDFVRDESCTPSG